eukprot:CAMPEP_0180193804 /NCGR_PEP_ID=MMETSP0987-20121128/2706_1 /TAXON_ID=697907 /ORGANISM="non described non described, Strain CCMP2293" /LENGTH=149 /DNA_ID=CAMNT_0022148517 /DNA_START=1 /DNA_END=448 /DNA_ORIENTATION=+
MVLPGHGAGEEKWAAWGASEDGMGSMAVGLAQVSVAAAGEGVPNWGALVRSTEVLPRDGHTRGRSVWTSLDRPLRGGYCEKTPLATPKKLGRSQSQDPLLSSNWGSPWVWGESGKRSWESGLVGEGEFRDLDSASEQVYESTQTPSVLA